MQKKICLLLIFLFAALCVAYADLPSGLEVDVNLDVTMFGLEKNDKSDVSLRRWAGNYKPLLLYLPGSRTGNWISDAGFSMNYDGKFFGGTLSVGTTVKENRIEYTDPVGKFNTLKAWVKPFGEMFKFTAGVGIGSGYADSLGADPGMRIYNGVEQASWDADRDPDNITQDKGVLLESFIGPVSIALAGRYYNPTVFALDLNPTDPNQEEQHTKWAYKNESEFSYGLRLGSLVGEWGKVNASYILEWSNYGEDSQNFYTKDRDGVIVPAFATAETTTHLFGLYASLKPLPDLGLSLGYNGILTQYLDQFYSAGDWQETTMPQVYKQAVNLNLRYSGVSRWVFRTDHNISFWTDKNYSIFGITAIKDMGTAAVSQTAGLADVAHLLIWNGLGCGYQLNNNWKFELYASNLYRNDLAQDVQVDLEEFRFNRNSTEGELKCVWQPNKNLEFYSSVILENTVTSISKDVNKRRVNEPNGFISQDVVNDTRDSTFLFKIPIGIIIRMR